MPFPLLAYIIILAISAAISYLLRPKPEEPDAAGLADWDIATCEQGTTYGIIFGRPPRFHSTMVLWYGDYYAKKIKDHDTTIGYAYHLGVHLGLCHAYVDGVLQIWVKDRCFWPTLDDETVYLADGETYIYVSRGDIWGGRHEGGGVLLPIYVLYGGSTQAANDYLKTHQDGADTPRYRGITSLVFKHAYWGKSPQLPKVGVVCKRTNVLHDGTAMWYIAKAVIGTDDDLNIIHVIRECLTSSIFGRGISTDDIDATTFEAAADTLYTEGYGISYRYLPGDGSISSFLSTLEQIMDGIILYNHATGKYEIKLIRDDFNSATLDEYDEDDFSIQTFHRPTYFQVPSETVVNYMDVASAKKAPAKEDDLALMELQGMNPVSQTFTWLMVTDKVLAQKLAAREQDQASKMPASLRLCAKRTMHSHVRGDVFKVSHPRLTSAGIASMTVRMVSGDRGTLEDGMLYIDVVEEIFEDIVVTDGSSGESETSVPPEVVYDGLQENITVTFNVMEVSIINESVS